MPYTMRSFTLVSQQQQLSSSANAPGSLHDSRLLKTYIQDLWIYLQITDY